MSQIRNNLQPTRGSYKPRNNRYRNSPNNKPRRRPRSFKTTQGEGWTKVSGNNTLNHSRRQQSQYQASPKTSQFNTANKFAALGEDDENDECLSSKSHRVEEVPTVIRTATVLKGAWGKGVSAAVKEEKTFEKQIVVEKEDPYSSMAPIGSDLNAILEHVKNSQETLLTPSNIEGWDWGDRIDSDSDIESEGWGNDYQ